MKRYPLFRCSTALRILAAALLASAAVVLAGCASTTAGGTVGAERKQLLLISSAQLASTAYQTLISTKFSRVDENEADRIGLE